jgi:hypothetical protein
LCAFLIAPDGVPLITRQLLHSACFGAAFVWLLADWPWQAVPTFVVVSLMLAGQWAVASLGDGLVCNYANDRREQARKTPSNRIGGLSQMFGMHSQVAPNVP